MVVSPVPDTLDLAPLDVILDRFEGRTGALIPILQAAQATFGYLPPEILQNIADRLNLSLGKVYGVATFYAQFYLEKRGTPRAARVRRHRLPRQRRAGPDGRHRRHVWG